VNDVLQRTIQRDFWLEAFEDYLALESGSSGLPHTH
jgi:hypothetical protein